MTKDLLKKLVRVFWLLPGFLLWASFPPMGEKMDVYFALAPLLWFSRNKAPGASFRIWFLNGMLFWVGTLSWMPAIVKNGGPWPLVVLGWGALSAYCALYFGAFGWLSSKAWSWTKGRGYCWRVAALVVVEPVLWAGLEIVRSRFGGGFSWNQLGVAPVNAGFGSPAALGGVYLVSAMVILVNGTIASIAERMLEPLMAARRKRLELAGGTVNVQNGDGEGAPVSSLPRWARSVETILPFALVWCVYGVSGRFVEYCIAEREAVGQRLSVALVQRNFPCVFKAAAADESPRDVYSRLLAGVAPLKPDLVVLPESAFAEFGELGSARAAAAAEWLMRTGCAKALVAGGSREDGGRLYNSAALYYAGGEGASAPLQIYDKAHLVPFGEYIPGDKFIPALQRLAPVGSCTPGELKLLRTGAPGVELGVAICYEDTDSAQMRELAKMGARALVFITNDSWFSESQEAVQHSWQAVARSIETGLPVIRVGNSGVTGVITPDGRASWLSGADRRPLVDERGVMSDVIVWFPHPRVWMPYGWLGDIPIFMSFLLLIGAMVMVKYVSNHEKRRQMSM